VQNRNEPAGEQGHSEYAISPRGPTGEGCVMNPQNFLIELKTAPVIAIFRRPKIDVQLCVKLLVEGGIRFIEMTMESEQAEGFLRSTKQMESDKVIFGAGTVTTLSLAKKAMFAGAKFLVSPNFNPEVVRFAREHDLPICCGAMTPTEIFAAHAAGADVIKVFSANAVGHQYFKELRGPFPGIPLIATGGINVSNASLYFHAGADAIGVGSALIPSENRQDLLQGCVETARKLLAASRDRF
jgi:2-dehydro-3-deoxyphosphogluconate aldolase / (4S)-4-hydroxy-2-oxoglutarate aldolase